MPVPNTARDDYTSPARAGIRELAKCYNQNGDPTARCTVLRSVTPGFVLYRLAVRIGHGLRRGWRTLGYRGFQRLQCQVAQLEPLDVAALLLVLVEDVFRVGRTSAARSPHREVFLELSLNSRAPQAPRRAFQAAVAFSGIFQLTLSCKYDRMNIRGSVATLLQSAAT